EVVAPRQVGQMLDLMQAVVRWGTGRAAALGRPAAGKTGTSQGFRDAWFIGFTAELVTGVWVGNDDDRPMSRVTGGGLPTRLWKAFMARALAGQPPRPLPVPAPEEQAPVAAAKPAAPPPARTASRDPFTALIEDLIGGGSEVGAARPAATRGPAWERGSHR
ncbi:MAG: carboxypeptidase, partial [Rhodospirillaceae bacterium]|nr:carboxypeptidase [Rhodospirillaceae bacterium]